ncbi:hypothetical protein PHYSODRAFT_252234 [Phytophthora sojae]|uniref:Uncharacterized protein n=1 Tax=Phytophthora sojae (strain P6497) TaxID=1094619 RepID=G5A6M6_PHYSP|nr:hypothetical protein PHYSODRAFT_252234 [Phytophthora sojae]EGZ08981.1 hypothetical protein PHYSODRAFT_252234 [Phytophthora sojae]|eukprot:XP_009535614.1 hypothetical protein PHYSODRAFT_252234 [Phytophthora sojae]
MLRCNATVPPGASLRPALVVFKDLQSENAHAIPDSAACARASSRQNGGGPHGGQGLWRPAPAVREDDGHPLQTNMSFAATVVVNGLGHGVVTEICKIQQSVQDASKGEENTLITDDVEEIVGSAVWTINYKNVSDPIYGSVLKRTYLTPERRGSAHA